MLFDSAGVGGWAPVIRYAVGTLGADQMCFGADYPYELDKAPYVRRVLDDIRAMDVDAQDKANSSAGTCAACSASDQSTSAPSTARRCTASRR